MSEFSTKSIPGQLTVDEAEGVVECFVAGIGNKDSVGDIVLPGAFAGSLKRRKPRVVWGHDWNHPIGRVIDIYEVGPDDPRLPDKMKMARIGGLFAKVQFNLRSERGREAFANIMFFGSDQEWSIGYKTIQAVYDNTRQANLLKEVELYEVSPVLHGANQLTATISIKSDQQDESRVTSFKKSKWPMFDREFAERIKKDHPEVWDKGGNIKGDDQYTILTKIAQQGGTATTEDQVRALELREAWIARHEKDFLLPGVIAQIKWLAIGSRGEGHMKDVVREAIANDSEGKGYGHAKPNANQQEELAEAWRRLRGYAAGRGSSNDDPRVELSRIASSENEAPKNPAMGRDAVLARALANELRTPIKIRTVTANTVVFDVMDEADPKNVTTMRSSWHAEDGQIMIGKPEPVRVETVYVPMDGGEGEAYTGDENMKADPRAGIPQERLTGDVLRGYGPRRGNLERLLRYWRPIMKKPGGFRRCLVILADHPELYPLQNICAWLHHETTGLWPNEGCHHPGMKNCRRKLRGVRSGSLWSDSEFNTRIRKLGDKKGMPWEDDDDETVVTDDDVKYANHVLNQFLMDEKEFALYLSDDKNWDHEGDDQNGAAISHEWVKPDGYGDSDDDHDCGCGCKGKGGPNTCSPYKSVEDSLNDLEAKVGRVLNTRNAEKISQAIQLLSDVLGPEAPTIERKDDGTVVVSAAMEDLFDLRSTLEPVIDYYGLDSEVTEQGVVLSGDFELAGKALDVAVGAFSDIQIKEAMDEFNTKGIGRRLGRMIPGGGRGGRGSRGGRSGGGRGGRGGSSNARFNPNADDADGDGMLQDNTPFERPTRPKKPAVAKGKRRRGSTPASTSRTANRSDASGKENLKDWSDSPLSMLYDDAMEGKPTGKFDPDEVKKTMNSRLDERIREIATRSNKLREARRAVEAARKEDPDNETPANKLWRQKLDGAINDFNVNELLGSWRGDGDLPKDYDEAFDAFVDDDENMTALFNDFNVDNDIGPRNAREYTDDFADWILGDAVHDTNLVKRQTLATWFEDMWTDE